MTQIIYFAKDSEFEEFDICESCDEMKHVYLLVDCESKKAWYICKDCERLGKFP